MKDRTDYPIQYGETITIHGMSSRGVLARTGRGLEIVIGNFDAIREDFVDDPEELPS